MEKQPSAARTVLTVLTVAGLVLLAGCAGLTQPPLAPDASNSGLHAAKPAKARSSGQEESPASSSPVYCESVTKFVSSWDEELCVKFRSYGGADDVTVKDATLYIETASVVGGGDYDVTMDAYSGTTLDDVNIVFSPSGLEFLPTATLTLRLLGPVTAEEVREARHICGDGTNVESITTQTSRNGESFLVVKIRVPGFSQYSLGGDDYRAGQNIMMMW